MKTKEPIDSESMGQTIVRRSGVGSNDLIVSWQSVLSHMLDQMQPFMQPARIITFQRMQPYEQDVFQQINQQVTISEKTWGIYLPPSVRNQLMYTNQSLDIPAGEAAPRDEVCCYSASQLHTKRLSMAYWPTSHLHLLWMYTKKELFWLVMFTITSMHVLPI